VRATLMYGKRIFTAAAAATAAGETTEVRQIVRDTTVLSVRSAIRQLGIEVSWTKLP